MSAQPWIQSLLVYLYSGFFPENFLPTSHWIILKTFLIPKLLSRRSQDVLKASRVTVIWRVTSYENQVRTQFCLLPFHLSFSVYKIDSSQEGRVSLCFFCKNWSVLAEWEHKDLNSHSNFQLHTQVSKLKHLPLRKHFSWSCEGRKPQAHYSSEQSGSLTLPFHDAGH